MNLASWQSSGRPILFRGHRAFVRESGDGPAILFLHGFPTSSFDFADVVARLGGGYRCVAFDFLGFGASSKPFPYRYRYDEQVELTLAVARETGLVDALVVAHDYGVSVAQELLARASERRLGFDLRGVVFLNGGVVPSLHRPLLAQRLLSSPLGQRLGRFVLGRRTFERSMDRVLVRPPPAGFYEESWAAIAANDGVRVMPLLLDYMAERRANAARWEGALRRPPVPVSYVWGMGDPVSGRHMLAGVAREAPDSPRVELEGVGHYPQTEAPKEVADAIAAAARRG